MRKMAKFFAGIFGSVTEKAEATLRVENPETQQTVAENPIKLSELPPYAGPPCPFYGFAGVPMREGTIYLNNSRNGCGLQDWHTVCQMVGSTEGVALKTCWFVSEENPCSEDNKAVIKKIISEGRAFPRELDSKGDGSCRFSEPFRNWFAYVMKNA